MMRETRGEISPVSEPTRSFPEGMDEAIIASIDATLASIARNQQVKIPLAVESGSRAWGFPSPDSDYDCRFVFLRPVAQCLSPWPRRDVIETDSDSVLDVNGWELGKALKLLAKGNAVIIEWLTSPITYLEDREFRDGFLTLAREIAPRELVGRHYLHLGERQRSAHFAGGKRVARKKIFYALRPAAALRWLRQRPGESIAPMHFPTLLAECEPPSEVLKLAEEMMAEKAKSREMGMGTLPRPIADFIDEEYRLAGDTFMSGAPAGSPEAKGKVEGFFLATLERLMGKPIHGV
jgi:predicted nucleotidyltransferase